MAGSPGGASAERPPKDRSLFVEPSATQAKARLGQAPSGECPVLPTGSHVSGHRGPRLPRHPRGEGPAVRGRKSPGAVSMLGCPSCTAACKWPPLCRPDPRPGTVARVWAPRPRRREAPVWGGRSAARTRGTGSAAAERALPVPREGDLAGQGHLPVTSHCHSARASPARCAIGQAVALGSPRSGIPCGGPSPPPPATETCAQSTRPQGRRSPAGHREGQAGGGGRGLGPSNWEFL